LEGRTGMRSEYFWRMRSASALRFSNGLCGVSVHPLSSRVCGCYLTAAAVVSNQAVASARQGKRQRTSSLNTDRILAVLSGFCWVCREVSAKAVWIGGGRLVDAGQEERDVR
jgi:hypothetical protein